jgi:hypothetical protein
MTCEEYVVQELLTTKEKLADLQWRLAEYRKEMDRINNVLSAFAVKMKVETYNSHRVISIDDIWDSSQYFKPVYEYFKNVLEREEKDNGEQSETCEPAES